MSRRASSSDSEGIVTGATGWFQKTITVKAPSRGCHLITDDVISSVPELKKFVVGQAQIFIKHTSASLSLNENADPTVREDMENALSRIIPDSWSKDFLKHTDEGADDSTSHIKTSLLGTSVLIPITQGRLNLGTWQGIYLCEHRDQGGWGGGHSRRLVITLHGLVQQ